MIRKVGLLSILLAIIVTVPSVAGVCFVPLSPIPYDEAKCNILQDKVCETTWSCNGDDAYPVETCVCKYPWEYLSWDEILGKVKVFLVTLPLPPEPIPGYICEVGADVLELSGIDVVRMEKTETTCPTTGDVVDIINLWEDGQVELGCAIDIIDAWSSC